ncbi:site-specific DNA-methyltransferase [Candidatus Sumerlaeota bacterium]|nr:site-specific DNA-methyltransferase [Candidatus Sumerlaeota bacterium]
MTNTPQSKRAPRNRTLTLSDDDRRRLKPRLQTLDAPAKLDAIVNTTIHQDVFKALPLLPDACADLVFADPPYNLKQPFNSVNFNPDELQQYQEWLESWLALLQRIMKPGASIYICGDWRSSPAIYHAASKFFKVRNRITWEREKGRGAKANWKNSHEDVWFCTASNDYCFNVDAVKLKRRVIAPYKHDDGQPKDWNAGDDGNFRLTHPSNLWTDLSVPFWSMPENTDHPTQKPEKLLAKVILASSHPDDLVLDPFLGSGAASVVAKKLGRRYIGIEQNEEYCLLAERRLELVETDPTIQGYTGGVFWERNTLAQQQNQSSSKTR